MKYFPYILLIVFLVVGIGTTAHISHGQMPQEITPTEVYYLAKSLDASLERMYSISDEPFLKKRISENLRPRNVYQKALSVVEEFRVLHPDAVAMEELTAAQRVDASQTTPSDVYNLLSKIADYFAVRGMLVEIEDIREKKVPSDVYQMLRQLTWHHIQIAEHKDIVTDWAAVPRVYEAVVKNFLPAAQSMADESGVSYQDYPFPRQPVHDVAPRNIYKLISHIYGNIARYYQLKHEYDPIELLEVNDCDEISPTDVFDLIQIVVAELKAEIGVKPLAATTAEQYAAWRERQDSIVPGHTFRLGQYIYILTKRVLETTS